MTPNFKRPIAGAHYTSDTRNYPWHRPPDITDYDGAVEYMINLINDTEKTEMVVIDIDATKFHDLHHLIDNHLTCCFNTKHIINFYDVITHGSLCVNIIKC